MPKSSVRDSYSSRDISHLLKQRLKGIDISDPVLQMIIDSYVDAKRDILLSGGVVEEKGLGSTKLQTRGVPKRFSELGFTVKFDSVIDNDLRLLAIEKVNKEDGFKEILESGK